MDVIRRGRADLASWVGAAPGDLYAANPCLRALHAHGWSDAERAIYAPALHRFGAQVAGPLDAAVRDCLGAPFYRARAFLPSSMQSQSSSLAVPCYL